MTQSHRDKWVRKVAFLLKESVVYTLTRESVLSFPQLFARANNPGGMVRSILHLHSQFSIGPLAGLIKTSVYFLVVLTTVGLL